MDEIWDLTESVSEGFPSYSLVSKYNVGLKTLLLQGLSETEFHGDLVYKFRKNNYKILVIIYMFCDILHAWLLIQPRLRILLTSLIARR